MAHPRCPDDKKHYRCVNGTCVVAAFYCKSPSPKCGGVRRYYCGVDNGDYCVQDDLSCMRPCGSRVSYLSYKQKCKDYPGKCVWGLKWQCPAKCGPGEVRCPQSYTGFSYNNRKCAKNQNWCSECRGHRCQDTGKCLNSYSKCNHVNDCSDGSDERYCPKQPTIKPDSNDGDDMSVIYISVGIISVIVLLMCCVGVTWGRKRRRSGEAVAYRSQRTESRGPQIAGATPVQSVPYIPPGNPYVEIHPGSDMGRHQNQSTNPSASTAMPSAPPHNTSGCACADPPPSYAEAVEGQDPFGRQGDGLPSYTEAAHLPPKPS